jgi:hypothetical protein
MCLGMQAEELHYGQLHSNISVAQVMTACCTGWNNCSHQKRRAAGQLLAKSSTYHQCNCCEYHHSCYSSSSSGRIITIALLVPCKTAL